MTLVEQLNAVFAPIFAFLLFILVLLGAWLIFEKVARAAIKHEEQ